LTGWETRNGSGPTPSFTRGRGAGSASVGATLTGDNAVLNMRVTLPGSGSHTGPGTLLGWKVNGNRFHDTSGGLSSDGYCRVNFENGGSWNVPMHNVTVLGSGSESGSPWLQAQTAMYSGSGSWQINGQSAEASGGRTGYGIAVVPTPFPSSGCHTAVVRVNAQGSVGVGVVTSFDEVKRHSGDEKAWIGNGEYGWCLFDDGDCAHRGSWNSGSLRIDRDGGTVAVTFDAGRSSISFETGNGRKRENVYTDLPSRVYLAVSVGSSGGKFELVSSTFALGGGSTEGGTGAGRPSVGDRVALRGGAEQRGPLANGRVGKLVADDGSSVPYQCEYGGETWWYTAADVVKAGAEAGDPLDP
jgi:hypothetical protein